MTVGDLPERLEAVARTQRSRGFAYLAAPVEEAAARIRALEGENARLTGERDEARQERGEWKTAAGKAVGHYDRLKARAESAEASLAKAVEENARLRQALFGGPAMERVAEGKTKFSASIRQEPKG